MKNRKFASKINTLLVNLYRDDPEAVAAFAGATKGQMLKMLKKLLAPANANAEIVERCIGLMTTGSGPLVFGTDPLTPDRLVTKLACCIVSYIKKNLESPHQGVAESGPSYYSFPIVPEDYLMKELSRGKTADYEFAASWGVKHHDNKIGTISFTKFPRCEGRCYSRHNSAQRASVFNTLQEALNGLMVEDELWRKTDITLTLPKGFKAERISSTIPVHQYLITRRGHSVGEISYLYGSPDTERHQPVPEGFMWACYKADDCDDGVPTAQEAVDRLIHCYLSYIEEKK